jgi:hypothetical protein
MSLSKLKRALAVLLKLGVDINATYEHFLSGKGFSHRALEF